jgi:hypothetical protein
MVFFNSMEEFQQNCQSVDRQQLVFFGEKKFVSNATPMYRLALPNVLPTISVDTELFPKWFDVIDSCACEGLGPFSVFDEKDRQRYNVKGITSSLVEGYFEDKLIPFMNARGVAAQIVCADRSTAHNFARLSKLCSEELGDLFNTMWIIPANAGKLVNPCDRDMHSEVQKHYADFLMNTKRTPRDIDNAIQHAYGTTPAKHASGWFRRCELVRIIGPEKK